MRKALILIAVSMLPTSCDFGRLRAEGRPVQEAWGIAASDLRVSPASSPLRPDREIPVLSAPEVFAVYVPSRLDRARDLLIGEHWIYFRLRDGEWFIEREREPEWTATEAATPGDFLPLCDLDGMDRAVIPWKEPKSP